MRSRYNPAVGLAYRASSRFWHRLDGRYGGPLTDLPARMRQLLTVLRRERARGVSLRGGKAGW